MGEPSERQDVAATRKQQRARRSQLIFVGVILIAAVAVYLIQTKRPEGLTKGWPANLPKVLQKAKSESRKVIVLFIGSPPSKTTRDLFSGTLSKPQNHKAIEDGGFLRAHVETDISSEQAKRYRIDKLPTMLLLGPHGEELNRREGHMVIGEVSFRNEFLTCETVHKP